MKCKTIIVILTLVSLAIAIAASYDFLRLAIIRATVHIPLPAWLQALLWGW